jgi:hypothetical protein
MDAMKLHPFRANESNPPDVELRAAGATGTTITTAKSTGLWYRTPTEAPFKLEGCHLSSPRFERQSKRTTSLWLAGCFHQKHTF